MYEKKQIKYNRVQRTGKISYIVIHDTGNKSKGANADAHFNYFNGGNRNASADFFVDDKKVLRINDYTKYATWHVGDGKGKYGITNQNSVGIEICVNADGDYKEAVKKTIELTKFLMKELNVSIDRVVRHYDASRKNCPASMKEADWKAFKKALEERPVETTKTEVKTESQTVMKIPNNVYVQEINPKNFSLKVCDCEKRDAGILRYFNAGFFSGDANVTVPVGNLACDGKIVTQSKDNESWINVAKKKLTTIYTTVDGACGITKTDDLTSIGGLKNAVSGIPIIVGGKRVPLDDIKAEGYDGGECYNTWHGFLGIRHGKLVYVAMKCDFEPMCWTLVALGIYDAIKLDGGGSFILHDVKELEGTDENRRIHNVGVWTE